MKEKTAQERKASFEDSGCCDEQQALEESFVRRAQKGNEKAFAWLMERYYSGLRVFVKLRVGEGQTVDDVLQEVWIKVYKKLPVLPGPRGFQAFVYRIARCCAVDRYRKQGWIQESEGAYGSQHTEGSSDFDPIGELLKKEKAELVNQAISQLPTELAAVLTLKWLRHMKMREIAEIEGIPLGTVKSRLDRAGGALKAILEERGYDWA